MTGYRTVDVDSLPNAPSPTTHKKEVDEAVGATAFGFNVYTADPGQQISMGYHYHPEHEEVMYVLAGRLAFETPEGELTVEAGEAFFVPAGAPQKGRAIGDEPARFIAVGGPKDRDHAVIEEPCGACGERTGREFAFGEREVVLVCADCGAEAERFVAGPE